MAKQSKAQVSVTLLPAYAYKNRWGVSGSAAMPYIVSEAKDGNWACSCMAWTRNHPREDCKHIMRVKLQDQFEHGARFAPATVASTPSLAVIQYTGRKMR